MSASTKDVGTGLDIGDVKCSMLEIIDGIFNNVLDLHLSNQMWYIFLLYSILWCHSALWNFEIFEICWNIF